MRTAALRWTVAIATLVALGCHGRPDTEENVRKALEEANIKSVDVDVVEDENIVHLSGTVETLAERTRAEEIAAATVGTTGRVVNELTVEVLEAPVPETPDQRITAALDRLIDNDPVLRERDINFNVSNGVVTITGEVRTADEKDRVRQIAKAAPGVKDVANSLQVTREH